MSMNLKFSLSLAIACCALSGCGDGSTPSADAGDADAGLTDGVSPDSSGPGTDKLFGGQIPAGGTVSLPKAIVSSLNVKLTTLWIFYQGANYNIQTWVNNTKKLVEGYQQDTNQPPLDIYLHIMPNNGTAPPAFHMPTDMAAYGNALTALSAALKSDGVHHYSIGNELSGYSWDGTPDTYATLLQASANALRIGDPDAIILDDGMAGEDYVFPIAQTMVDQGNGTEALAFVQAYLVRHNGFGSIPTTLNELTTALATPIALDRIAWSKARFTTFCPLYDVLELHDYQGWETMQMVYDWTKSQMQSNNCVKPIQIWELGYALDSGQLDYQDQAKSVAKMLAISAASGLQMINYFPIKDPNVIFKDLIDPNDNFYPAGTAFQATTGKLTGTTNGYRLDLGNASIYIYDFTASGSHVEVAWTGAGLTTVDVSSQFPNQNVNITDIANSTTTAPSNAVPISDSPVFLTP